MYVEVRRGRQCSQFNAGIFFMSQSADQACERQSAQSRDTRPSWAFMHLVVIPPMPDLLRHQYADSRVNLHVFLLALLEILLY